MIRVGFERELAGLQNDLLKMGTLVEEMIMKAIRSMLQKDAALAEEVIASDDVVDNLAMEIEHKCLSLIALQQPMAKDLRMIGSALRAIVDLERLGDHAGDLAKITIILKDEEYMKPLIDIPRMGDIVRAMIRKGLKAYIESDVDLAWTLVEDEQATDELYIQIFRELVGYMMENPKNIRQATYLLLAAGHLERMADHMTNVAEMVVYIAEGKRVDINRIARDRLK